MPISSRAAGLALAVAAIAALTGCSPAESLAIPKSVPSVKPVFATDADALAAAEKTYSGYLAASDVAAHSGGTDVDGLAQWDTAAQYKRDMKSFAVMRAQGHHTSGASTYSHARLQSFRVKTTGLAIVAIYVCDDISGTTLFDSGGQDMGQNRPLVLPLQVTFVSDSTSPRTLLMEGSVSWQGADFCS